jgi:hypothetical protein
MMMSKVLILKKTRNGSKAVPILKKVAQALVENGEAIRMNDGIYKYMDKTGKVETKETPEPIAKEKPKKKTYKTKILKAED